MSLSNSPKLKIRLHPDACLKKPCAPIEIDSAARELAQAMLETMYSAPGIGLAAPQVGRSSRLFVMDCTDKDTERSPLVLFNPEITEVADETHTQEEGCLSLPRLFEPITRPEWVVMRYWGLDGREVEQKFDGLWATCAQHELDHLNGILFIDHLSRVKRAILTKKMIKYKKDVLNLTGDKNG